MIDPTEEQYAAGIPICCSMQTMEEHMHIALCWGLCAALRAGKPMDCTGCDLKKSEVQPPREGDHT